jgi:hypothetical protein
MPFIDIAERTGIEKGLLEGIATCLKMRFGPEGERLLPELRELHELDTLRAVLQAIDTVNTPEELRQIWAGNQQ